MPFVPLAISELASLRGRREEEKEGNSGSERERKKRRGRRRELRAGFLVSRRASGNWDVRRESPQGRFELPICTARIK